MTFQIALEPARAQPLARSTADSLEPVAFEVSSLMRALGHSGRLMVLSHLADGSKTVSELQSLLDMSQPLVSSHLARLRHDGLVRFERAGKSKRYSLADGPARGLMDHLNAFFCDGLRHHL
ncbi:MAG: transcriptional regulator [Rhodobacterales bacterium]|nr:MAG: transcriptional regulator [Rhodobacterales bacterium]